MLGGTNEEAVSFPAYGKRRGPIVFTQKRRGASATAKGKAFSEKKKGGSYNPLWAGVRRSL